MRPTNSKFGLACLITGVTAFVTYITLGQIALLFDIADQSNASTVMTLIGILVLCIPSTISLIALGFGIAALRIKNKKKEYVIIGMVFAAVPLVMNALALLIAFVAIFSASA